MTQRLLPLLLLLNIGAVLGQSTENELKTSDPTTWDIYLIEPGLSIKLPVEPSFLVEDGKGFYEVKHSCNRFIITTEEGLDFKGRLIKEVEDEFYGGLNASIEDGGNRIILEEKNYKISGHKARVLSFVEKVNESESIKGAVLILVVNGCESAIYKLFCYHKCDQENNLCEALFNSIDLYRELELELSDAKDEATTNDIFERESFITPGVHSDWRDVSDWEVYDNKYFNLAYPKGSSIYQREDFITITPQAVNANDVGIAIETVSRDSFELYTIEAIEKSVIENLSSAEYFEQIGTNYRHLKSGKAFELTTEEVIKGEHLIFRCLFILHEKEMISVLFYAPKDKYEHLSKTADKIFNSIE